MDEDNFMLEVLDDLQAVLQPVVNSGASRDQLAEAAKKALGIVEDAYDVIEQDEEDEDDEEEPVHHVEEEEEEEGDEDEG